MDFSWFRKMTPAQRGDWLLYQSCLLAVVMAPLYLVVTLTLWRLLPHLPHLIVIAIAGMFGSLLSSILIVTLGRRPFMRWQARRALNEN
jgi:hypothetical protein